LPRGRTTITRRADIILERPAKERRNITNTQRKWTSNLGLFEGRHNKKLGEKRRESSRRNGPRLGKMRNVSVREKVIETLVRKRSRGAGLRVTGERLGNVTTNGRANKWISILLR